MSEAAELSVLSPEPDDQVPESCSDFVLLDAWRRHHDADAFAALVKRYSRLVMGVCRRQCRSQEDAEDAFQATFMILARDSKKIRSVQVLSTWLYRVAYRTACRARSRTPDAQPLTEEPIGTGDPLESIAARHRLRALDEELSKLPPRYREPIVLHYLEGQTCQQTADSLGSTEPAIRGRLQRAKKELQRRLLRRGITLGATIAALQVLTEQQAVASELITKTTSLAVDPSIASTARIDLSPLLAKEPIMLSKLSVLGIVSAGMLGLAGFALAQQGTADPFGGSSSNGESVVADPFATNSTDSQPAATVELSVETAADVAASSNGSGWLSTNSEAVSEIERKLSDKQSLTLIDVPLEDVAREMSEKNDLQIYIDRRALEEIGLSADQPVRLEAKNVTLESLLNLITRELDLTFIVEDELLKITTVEAAEMRPMIRVYWESENGLQFDESAANLIQTMIVPDSWSQLGGPGTISVMEADDQRQSALVVSTSFAVHREIERLLQTIQQGAAQPLHAVEESSAQPPPFGAAPVDEEFGGGGSF